MFVDVDPELLFKLFSRFISPNFLRWTILILTLYQTLSLMWQCLKLIKSVIQMILWLAKAGRAIWAGLKNLGKRLRRSKAS
ncbi:P-overlapping protein [Raspberry vein chlorosis virus]|uniref:p-overlapping protein n=1 Tax=Raspberry vein chlorosis virus TaxID=758677 RepID=A0A482PGD3_9RHAB|nr:P-overlapping protein [Raspberry vein chlorosis virus]QBS46630.1 P-overlapping protein [Raspberry vein chlorosis virus]